MSNLPTREEEDAYEASLDDNGREELRKARIVQGLVSRKEDKPVDWSSLSPGEFDRLSTQLFAEHERRKAKGE